jgi:glycosyltransferase involved in cell wall biosynthesis
MEAHYARARVVVVPSLWPEPFGLVGVEAMARGRPVVGIDRGGIREWLAHGETGLRVEPTAATLAAAIQRLLNEPELALCFGRAGREQWRERFSPAVHAGLLEDAYRWAMERQCGAERPRDQALSHPDRTWRGV